MEKILSNILNFSSSARDNGTRPLGTIEASPVPPKAAKRGLSLICFSKGRPYQLHQLLLSIKRYFVEPPQRVIVLYCTEIYEEQYEKLFKYHATVFGIEEVAFHEDLMRIFDEITTSHVMFCVDDLIFFREFNYR